MAMGRKQGTGKRDQKDQGNEKTGNKKTGSKEARRRGAKNRGQGSGDRDRKNSGRGSEGTREQANNVEGAKPAPRYRGNGAARLRSSASKVVSENSEKLVNLLLEDAKKGKMESARLLVKLAEESDPPKTRKRRGPSLADKLAAEPQWEERHGGLSIDDLPGSEENWEAETAEAMERQGLGT
jgi:hypothetical protein